MPLDILLKDKTQKNIALISSALLIIVLGYWLGLLYWQMTFDNAKDTDESIQQIFQSNSGKLQTQQRIAPLHLFGKADKVSVRQVKKTTTVAPISRLNLKLKGVFASTPIETSLAIISSGKRDELMYAVGEALPGGAILKEVYEDKVIIERNGSLETLLLSQEKADISTKVVDEPLQNEQVFRSTPKELRVQLLKDPSQIPKIMATIPEYKNGKIIGYKLRMKKYQGILQQYGLQKNDVVTNINGIDITKKANAFKLLQQLTNAKALDLNVLRNGQKESLSISLN